MFETYGLPSGLKTLNALSAELPAERSGFSFGCHSNVHLCELRFIPLSHVELVWNYGPHDHYEERLGTVAINEMGWTASLKVSTESCQYISECLDELLNVL